MSGVAISPYAQLWFVGTDMGTLFRSTNQGQSWNAINHYQTTFDSDLSKAVSPGFSSDGVTVFHSRGGLHPQRSSDQGKTFHPLTLPLLKDEYIKYWKGHPLNSLMIFAGTTKGLLYTTDKGQSWKRATSFSEESIETFIDEANGNIYHATSSTIWLSQNKALSFNRYYQSRNLFIRQFTGGRDQSGLTLLFGDNNGKTACAWDKNTLTTIKNCGYLWQSFNNSPFQKTDRVVGDHLKMARNNSSTIYVTGSRYWPKQYGTKIFVSANRGESWELKLNQIDWDVTPFRTWPSDQIEYSAVSLDVGWMDSGYESFVVHEKNAQIAAGSGYFFLHSTLNRGENWKASFSQFSDSGNPEKGKFWKTRGIEVISVYKAKFHPLNSDHLFVAAADIGGMISEDHGKTFRISQAEYNSNYDYSFDLLNPDVIYAASGASHDYPMEWHANAIKSEGGIYQSSDLGRNWLRLTPSKGDFNRQFLSVAYDSKNKRIYGGSHETGIILSTDLGKSWKYFNRGLPSGSKIIPQIEIDADTGNVYALLTGNAPYFTNHLYTGIYFLDVENGATSWKLLRKNVTYPAEARKGSKVWYYPTSFALDASGTLWLTDYENTNNWLMTGIWKSTDGGQNWSRVFQMTHATDIKIDPRDPQKVYASGYHQLDGLWGHGGQYSSQDGGVSWKKNLIPPLQKNARSVLLDPTNHRQIIYTYFGGGMLLGPNPNQ